MSKIVNVEMIRAEPRKALIRNRGESPDSTVWLKIEGNTNHAPGTIYVILDEDGVRAMIEALLAASTGEQHVAINTVLDNPKPYRERGHAQDGSKSFTVHALVDGEYIETTPPKEESEV